MFSLREYIKKGFIDAVGKMSNYQIILNSAGWMDKGVLTEEDLTEINTAIESWELEQSQKAEISNDFVTGKEITTEDENVFISGEYEATEGNNEDILTEETEQPIDSEDDGEPLT